LEIDKKIVKGITLPFRMFNKNSLKLDEYVYALSLKVFDKCNIDTARKITNYSIQKNWLKKENNSIILNVPINPINELIFNLPINLDFFKDIEMIELIPLPQIEPFKPVYKKIKNGAFQKDTTKKEKQKKDIKKEEKIKKVVDVKKKTPKSTKKKSEPEQKSKKSPKKTTKKQLKQKDKPKTLDSFFK